MDWKKSEKFRNDYKLRDRAGFLQIGGVEVGNELIGMLEFHGREPG